MFCPYKRFPNLKDLMVGVYLYSIKPLKEIDQHLGRSVCMKRIYSCKNSVDHISSFECFATKKRIKTRRYLTCSTQNMIYQPYCSKCGKCAVGQLKIGNPDFLIINHA